MKSITKLTLVAIMAVSLSASDFSNLNNDELKKSISTLGAKDIGSFKAEVIKRLDNMLVKDARVYCNEIRTSFRDKISNMRVADAREFRKDSSAKGLCGDLFSQKGKFGKKGNNMKNGNKGNMKKQKNFNQQPCQNGQDCPRNNQS